MHLITDLKFNQELEVYSFHFNESGHELTNASQYTDDQKRYKWKTPYPSTENERFVLIGDGNYKVSTDQFIKQIAYVIIQKVGTLDSYTLKRDNFNNEFVLA